MQSTVAVNASLCVCFHTHCTFWKNAYNVCAGLQTWRSIVPLLKLTFINYDSAEILCITNNMIVSLFVSYKIHSKHS